MLVCFNSDNSASADIKLYVYLKFSDTYNLGKTTNKQANTKLGKVSRMTPLQTRNIKNVLQPERFRIKQRQMWYN